MAWLGAFTPHLQGIVEKSFRPRRHHLHNVGSRPTTPMIYRDGAVYDLCMMTHEPSTCIDLTGRPAFAAGGASADVVLAAVVVAGEAAAAAPETMLELRNETVGGLVNDSD